MIKIPDDFKMGITLSGGAAYGSAHVGIIKALREYGLEFDLLYGTSAGAIASVLYASGASIRDMKEFLHGINLMNIRSLRLPTVGFMPLTFLQKRLAEFVPYKNLEDLPRKVLIGVTNLETGHHETLDTGAIYTAVAASCAVPVIFTPIEHDGKLYVDGGVSNNMPALPLKKTCDFVLGSDVVEMKSLDRKHFNGFRKILERTLTISLSNRTTFNYPDCDFVIRTSGLYKYGKFDLKHSEEIIQNGYNQALIDLPNILDVLHHKMMQKLEHTSPKS